MKVILFLFITLFCSSFIYGQSDSWDNQIKNGTANLINVTERTLKIPANSEENMYFGFAQGDKIVFNFSEIDKKELKEVEIIEYPSNSKFTDYKTVKIENKVIDVNKTGVFRFRFLNSNMLSPRICKINIQRFPASVETKNFNTSVKAITKQDTTWTSYTKDVLIGYDTLLRQATKKVLVRVDTSESMIMDKTEQVADGETRWAFFTIPAPEINGYKEKKAIAWAYWVGVGEESDIAWQRNVKTISGFATKAGGLLLSPLGALSLGLIANLALPATGEDVAYNLVDENNRNLIASGYTQWKEYDSGKGVAGFKSFSHPGMCKGASFFVRMYNDNMFYDINVKVKVSVISEIKTYQDKQYVERKVSPKYEKQIMREPQIKTYQEMIIEN